MSIQRMHTGQCYFRFVTGGKLGLLALFSVRQGNGLICHLSNWGLASPALNLKSVFCLSTKMHNLEMSSDLVIPWLSINLKFSFIHLLGVDDAFLLLSAFVEWCKSWLSAVMDRQMKLDLLVLYSCR